MFARPRQIARGLVSSDQIWFLALGVIACSISAHGGAGYVARLYVRLTTVAASVTTWHVKIIFRFQ